MDHLTLDDVIEFVSLTEINEESMQRISAVNTHIAACDECRVLVRSFQTVYDELTRADGFAEADTEDVVAAAFSLADPDDENNALL